MATATRTQPTIPGPRSIPLLGWLGNTMRFLHDPIPFLRVVHAAVGDIGGVAQNSRRVIFVFTPEYNRQILTNPDLFNTIFEATMPERIKKRRTGIGLLHMNGEQHRQQRRLMLPALHKKHIEGYRDDMVAIAEQVLERWQPGQQIDVAHELQQLTLRVASKTLLGLDVSDRVEGVGLMIKRLLETPLNSIAFFPFDLPGTPYRRMLRNADQLDAEILAMIQRKREHPARDLLTMLIQARDEDGTAMTETELLGQTTTLLITGHETSSNMMAWTLFLLAQHPAVLADLVDELESTLHGAPPTLEQMNQLPLLERVIKESLRILPPSSLGSRITTDAVQIGPYDLPKGTIVVFSQYITHRRTEVYVEPQRFDPARWEQIEPSAYEYLPFGAGPRLCLGSSFAMLEIKIVLAMILQRFRLTVVPGSTIDLQMRLALTPKHGMPMTVAAQDRRFTRTAVRGNVHDSVELS